MVDFCHEHDCVGEYLYALRREMRWWLVQGAVAWVLALHMCNGGGGKLLATIAATTAATAVNAAAQPVLYPLPYSLSGCF